MTVSALLAVFQSAWVRRVPRLCPPALLFKGMDMTSEPIEVKLTSDEALVLFEWLVQLDSTVVSLDANSAEQKVLWRIEAQLERALVEPLAPNYKLLLKEARRKISGTT